MMRYDIVACMTKRDIQMKDYIYTHNVNENHNNTLFIIDLVRQETSRVTLLFLVTILPIHV